MSVTLTVKVSTSPGICRWCGCSHFQPCPGGCAWADLKQTLCTECVRLDTALRTRSGRKELADFLQEHLFDGPPVLPLPVPRRRRPRRRAS